MHIKIVPRSVAWRAHDVSLHVWFLSPASPCLCFAGSWSCHLCLALLKDKASIYQQNQNSAPEWHHKSSPLRGGTPTFSGNVRPPVSFRLCPDVAESDHRSALTVLKSTASGAGGGVGKSNYHYQPACKVHVACCQTHTYWSYIYSIDTLSLSWTLWLLSPWELPGERGLASQLITCTLLHADILWTIDKFLFCQIIYFYSLNTGERKYHHK